MWEVRGLGKEPDSEKELPDLNKVNFPAIWPVFGMDCEALEAGGALVLILTIQSS